MMDDTGKLRGLLETAWGIIANAGGGNWDRETAQWKAAAERWRDEYHHVDELSASEALYGFAGWLTTRAETFLVGATANAAPVAEAVQRFCETNHLAAPRDGWANRLRHPAD